MRFFFVGRERSSGTVRLVSDRTFSNREEALDEMQSLLPSDGSMDSHDLFVVDLDAVMPIVMVRARGGVTDVGLASPQAGPLANEVIPPDLLEPIEDGAPEGEGKGGGLAAALRKAATQLEGEGITAPPQVEELAAIAEAATEEAPAEAAAAEEAPAEEAPARPKAKAKKKKKKKSGAAAPEEWPWDVARAAEAEETFQPSGLDEPAIEEISMLSAPEVPVDIKPLIMGDYVEIPDEEGVPQEMPDLMLSPDPMLGEIPHETAEVADEQPAEEEPAEAVAEEAPVEEVPVEEAVAEEAVEVAAEEPPAQETAAEEDEPIIVEDVRRAGRGARAAVAHVTIEEPPIEEAVTEEPLAEEPPMEEPAPEEPAPEEPPLEEVAPEEPPAEEPPVEASLEDALAGAILPELPDEPTDAWGSADLLIESGVLDLPVSGVVEPLGAGGTVDEDSALEAALAESGPVEEPPPSYDEDRTIVVPESGYVSAYACDECVYVATCPKAHQENPGTCGSFQWKA